MHCKTVSTPRMNCNIILISCLVSKNKGQPNYIATPIYIPHLMSPSPTPRLSLGPYISAVCPTPVHLFRASLSLSLSLSPPLHKMKSPSLGNEVAAFSALKMQKYGKRHERGKNNKKVIAPKRPKKQSYKNPFCMSPFKTPCVRKAKPPRVKAGRSKQPNRQPPFLPLPAPVYEMSSLTDKSWRGATRRSLVQIISASMAPCVARDIKSGKG